MFAWVINLDNRQDRLNRFLKNNNRYVFEIIRYPAYSKDDNIPDDIVGTFWNSTLNSIFDTKYQPHKIIKLSDSERGCAMSHYSLWKQIYDRNMPYGIIFEDDVQILPSNKNFIENYLNVLPNDWDIFYLDFIHGKRPVVVDYTNKIYKGIYIWNCSGYVINRKGVKKCLDNLPIDCSVDNYLAKLTVLGILNVYTPDRQLAVQNYGDSNIKHT